MSWIGSGRFNSRNHRKSAWLGELNSDPTFRLTQSWKKDKSRVFCRVFYPIFGHPPSTRHRYLFSATLSITTQEQELSYVTELVFNSCRVLLSPVSPSSPVCTTTYFSSRASTIRRPLSSAAGVRHPLSISPREIWRVLLPRDPASSAAGLGLGKLAAASRDSHMHPVKGMQCSP